MFDDETTTPVESTDEMTDETVMPEGEDAPEGTDMDSTDAAAS